MICKRYFPEAITTISLFYVLKYFSEKLNELNVGGYGITPMEKFTGTTIDITLKNHHTWGCPVYVLNAILQGNISGLPNW